MKIRWLTRSVMAVAALKDGSLHAFVNPETVLQYLDEFGQWEDVEKEVDLISREAAVMAVDSYNRKQKS